MFIENPEEGKLNTDQERKTLTEIVVELQKAINQHDLDAMTACFAPDYESEFPAHPDRAFRGQGQMRKNWSQIFSTVPDMEAVLLRSTSDGDMVWAEWEWRGTRGDGARHVMRGVTIQGAREGRINWVRLYMEPVQEGGGPDAAVSQNWMGEGKPTKTPQSLRSRESGER